MNRSTFFDCARVNRIGNVTGRFVRLRFGFALRRRAPFRLGATL